MTDDWGPELPTIPGYPENAKWIVVLNDRETYTSLEDCFFTPLTPEQEARLKDDERAEHESIRIRGVFHAAAAWPYA